MGTARNARSSVPFGGFGSEHDLVEHAAEPRPVGVGAPAVSVDHPRVRLDARDDRGGLDEFVEGNVVAQPASLAADVEHPTNLPADSGDQFAEVAVELGVDGGGADECLCDWRGPLVDRCLFGDEELDRFVAIGERQVALAEFEVEHVLVAGDAEGGVLDSGDHQRRLGPVGLHRLD